MTEFVTPHLRTVLKAFQNSATKSLQGPGHSLPAAVHHNSTSSALTSANSTIVKKEVLSSPEPLDASDTSALIVQAPPPPELSQPILSAPDSGRVELYETILEGKTIGCFYLGGEMRLCLPQFLNNVLTDFTLDQINRIFDELRIFCSQCTPDQLMVFKAAKILPDDVKASGLITRTDAERLCSALLHRSDRNSGLDDIPKGAISFKVYHRCFGKCEGICTPDLYSILKPACIMCLECKGMFSPQKFVGHAHRQQENRTCHWGFDSRNWHDYLHVALDVENREKYTKMLDDLRDLEQQEIMNAQRDMNFLKRKAEQLLPSPPCKREPIDIPSKKQKLFDESSYLLDYQRYQVQQALYYAHCAQQREQLSAFRPWAPTPLLQLPNRPVPPAALPYFAAANLEREKIEREKVERQREKITAIMEPEIGAFRNVPPAALPYFLSKEREKDRERRERERQREKLTAIIEPEIHIKQERPNSPDAIEQSSPEEEDHHMRIVSPTSINANTISNNSSSSSNQRRHSLHSHFSSTSPQDHHQLLSSPPPHHASSSSIASIQNLKSPPSHQPVSPDEISSSNEITSSTSPVPNNIKGCNNSNINTSPVATPIPQLQQQQQSLQQKLQQSATVGALEQLSKLSTAAAAADNIVCSPSRIRISKNLLSNANVVRSPTPPPATSRVEQSLNKSRSTQQQSPSQSSMSTLSSSNSNSNNHTATTTTPPPPPSSAAALALTRLTGGVLVKTHHFQFPNGTTEFEQLSNDTTDDDSLNGEPDSSIILAPWDLATDALKDTDPLNRDKVLQIIQRLVQENAQFRQCRLDNFKLLQQLRCRDEQIEDLQRELQHLQRQLHQSQKKLNSSLAGSNGSVIAKVDTSHQSGETSSSTSTSTTSTTSSYHPSQKPEIEKLKVPLKKSLRRSPEETVVVMNHQRGDNDLLTDIKVEQKTTNGIDAMVARTTATSPSSAATLTPTSSLSPDSANGQYDLKQTTSDKNHTTSSSSSSSSSSSTDVSLCIKTEQ